MTDRFCLTMAQLNPTVGDLAGNVAKAKAAWDEGKAAGADFGASAHQNQRQKQQSHAHH